VPTVAPRELEIEEEARLFRSPRHVAADAGDFLLESAAAAEEWACAGPMPARRARAPSRASKAGDVEYGPSRRPASIRRAAPLRRRGRRAFVFTYVCQKAPTIGARATDTRHPQRERKPWASSRRPTALTCASGSTSAPPASSARRPAGRHALKHRPGRPPAHAHVPDADVARCGRKRVPT
jgi:hypothetical protein